MLCRDYDLTLKPKSAIGHLVSAISRLILGVVRFSINSELTSYRENG
jgi:hypothetical protein